MKSNHPVSKLKTAQETPSEETCSCHPPRQWKLMYALGPNPIHCMGCNLEIQPDELQLPEPIIDTVVSWCNVWGSIYRLWLDSGPYETWALKELSDLDSAANRQSRAVTAKLTDVNPCYYQVFEDEGAPGWSPQVVCPICRATLESRRMGKFDYRLCDTCRLVFWNR